MMNLKLSDEKIYQGSLLLVNADHPLRENGEERLLPVNVQYPDILLMREAVYILHLIFDKLHCRDSIVPVSGYRSAEEQTEIFQSSLRENGEEYTRKYVAVPNHSEHQTGLAIDLGLKQGVIDFICPEFPYEGICDRFRRTAPAYGFVERYPKGKEEITGIGHEPWHFRYVGYPHSEIMSEYGLTLEEYMAWIKQFSCKSPLRWTKGSQVTEVFYTEAFQTGTTAITLPEDSLYMISGNNVDGFIVTRRCQQSYGFTIQAGPTGRWRRDYE